MKLGFSVAAEISGRALADLYYMGPGGLWWSNVQNSALPPQRLRPDTWPEHQDPVSHMASNMGPSGWCGLCQKETEFGSEAKESFILRLKNGEV